MSETIRLEVAAARSAFPTVRMVLGGLGMRADLSVEQLDDLYLATEELFRAAIEMEAGTRFGVEMRVDGSALRVAAGPFTSPTLRQRVKPGAPGAACLDLCRLLHNTVDEVLVDERAGSYHVVLVKSQRATA